MSPRSRSYPLPAYTGGGGTTVPIERSSQAILFDLLRDYVAPTTSRHAAPRHAEPRTQDGCEETTRVYFRLVPDPATGGYLVVHGHNRLGRVPAQLRTEYPQLDGLLAQGYEPEVAADIGFTKGSGRMGGNLYFPAPPLAVPANRPPTEPWAFLPGGTVRDIDTSAGEGRPTDTSGQWLGRLTVIEGIVVAAVDDRALGPLSEEDSAEIRDLVAHYQALGLIPVARIYCLQEDGRIRTVLDALATAEVSDDALEPDISPLPDITPAHPNTGEFPVVPEEAGVWAVTMAEEDVTEEFHAVPDRPLRRITVPEMPDEEPGRNSAAAERSPDAHAVDAADGADGALLPLDSGELTGFGDVPAPKRPTVPATEAPAFDQPDVRQAALEEWGVGNDAHATSHTEPSPARHRSPDAPSESDDPDAPASAGPDDSSPDPGYSWVYLVAAVLCAVLAAGAVLAQLPTVVAIVAGLLALLLVGVYGWCQRHGWRDR